VALALFTGRSPARAADYTAKKKPRIFRCLAFSTLCFRGRGTRAALEFQRELATVLPRELGVASVRKAFQSSSVEQLLFKSIVILAAILIAVEVAVLRFWIF
jgi:hypothetical protein